MKKIGIMGGSFDPPHKTHLKLAKVAYETLGLDEVFFIPAYISALKANPHTASFEDRLEMLNIALQKFDYPFKVLDLEKEREGLSYSIDTLRELKKNYEKADFYWIIGTDQLLQLDKWHEIKNFSNYTKFACFKRVGYDFDIPKNLPSNLEIIEIAFAQNDDSSSSARLELKNQRKNHDFIDENVLKYIEENKLYS